MGISELKLDSETLNGIVAKAIVDSLDDEQRAHFITVAVQKMVTPVRHPYGGSRDEPESPMQAAVKVAVQRVCNTLAEEIVAQNPAVISTLRDKITSTVVELMNDPNSKLYDQVGSAVSQAISTRSWD